MDRQSYAGQAAGEIQRQPSCLPTCSARGPVGPVLGGGGSKTRSGPLTPRFLFPFFSTFC